MKKYLAIILGILLSGCNQLAVLSVAGSTASLVINNNPLVKTYRFKITLRGFSLF